MSYILEALKKSQQQRELGRAPRLEEHWIEQIPDREPPHPWLIGTAVLAALALLVALYAVLRSSASPAPEPPPAIATASPNASVANSAANYANAAVQLAPPSQPPAPAPASQAAKSSNDEPNILVVPAPDPQGRPLPRGAEEIRRAVLGDAYPPPPDIAPPPMPAPAEVPQRVPVPEDLKAEIEAFKQSVKQRGGAAAAPKPKPAAAPDQSEVTAKLTPSPPVPVKPILPPEAAIAPGPEESSAVPPSITSGPSPALRQKLPPYSLSVHVYNSASAKRFVYINGSKIFEQDVTPEGLKVEEITQAGVILSFEGELFFERR
ncbi:general secretion pathway protein GspB [Rhabdochromatium marinum]|uniref:general secretion pathway protein GspB n=1 Tax=Rhabdochromatium marinum TaxID=48729 RepID=UPI0019057461|nr:general secretion pathway protein GspB [Rhabdochromatium marinum]MBK1649245.1 hypothetical protein [Rhabdochromatium marinum]